MGRGSEGEIGQSACTPPHLLPLLPHCPSRTEKVGQACVRDTCTRTHTHAVPDGKRVFNKMEPVWGSEDEVASCYVINSTLKAHCVIVLPIWARTQRSPKHRLGFDCKVDSLDSRLF